MASALIKCQQILQSLSRLFLISVYFCQSQANADVSMYKTLSCEHVTQHTERLPSQTLQIGALAESHWVWSKVRVGVVRVWVGVVKIGTELEEKQSFIGSVEVVCC